MTNVMCLKPKLAEFWWLARERYQMKLRRDAGLPWEEWTEDPLLKHYHFCNVFRWDDAASLEIAAWAQKLNDPWPAAVFGRLANRPATIRALAALPSAGPEDLGRLGAELGINTSAYKLNTPLGLNNAAGLVTMAEQALARRERVMAAADIPAALKVLGEVFALGGFVGYQMVLDMVELGNFPAGFDSSWSFPGPGAVRGAISITGGEVSSDWTDRLRRGLFSKEQLELCNRVMGRLHRASEDPANWPWVERPWSIHEVEFMLCEYDKYTRKRGAAKVSGRRYRGPGTSAR